MQVVNLTREDLVLRVYFLNLDLRNRLVPVLDKELFDEKENKLIVNLIVKFTAKYSQAPSAQELIVGLETSGYSETVRQKILTICNTDVPPMRIDLEINLVETFFKEKKYDRALEQAAECLHTHDIDGMHALMPLFKEATTFSLHANFGINVIDDAAEALRRLKCITGRVPTAVKEFSDLMRVVLKDPATGQMEIHPGGYPKQAVTFFVGASNVGKSLIMISESAFAARCGFNVLYITLEMPEDQIWARIAANTMDRPLWEIQTVDADTAKRGISESAIGSDGKHFGNLIVYWMRPGSTVNDIENAIDSLEDKYKSKFDMVAVDYIMLLAPNPGTMSKFDKSYERGVLCTRQFRTMCILRDKAGMSAVQVTREGMAAGAVDTQNVSTSLMHNVAGSMGYVTDSDVLLYIQADRMLKQCNAYMMYVVKSRYCDNDVMFMASRDTTHMRYGTLSADAMKKYNDLMISQPLEMQKSSAIPQTVQSAVNAAAHNAPPAKLTKKLQNSSAMPAGELM